MPPRPLAARTPQGFPLPPALRATTDLGAVVDHGELLLVVIPTPFVERTMERIRDQLRGDQARALLWFYLCSFHLYLLFHFILMYISCICIIYSSLFYYIYVVFEVHWPTGVVAQSGRGAVSAALSASPPSCGPSLHPLLPSPTSLPCPRPWPLLALPALH